VSRRIFLLSPASCGGERAGLLLNERARFDLARTLRTPGGAPLGAAFSFMSGLYFRGKLRYASVFARPPDGVPGVLVITPGDGLVPPESRVTMEVLRRWATIRVDPGDDSFSRPFARDLAVLASALAPHPGCDVVLLGSIASAKYLDALAATLGSCVRFPAEFVGRGDMSRGGLLLRHADAGVELAYVAAAGAERRGGRPPKLPPRVRPHAARGADAADPRGDGPAARRSRGL
jgi:hypothetical protein